VNFFDADGLTSKNLAEIDLFVPQTDAAAGVIEQGQFLVSDKGTGQGQTISPLLANIYLHHVLDEWFEEVVKPRRRGEAHEIRFADDAILGFHYREDAEKVKDVLSKRFAKYGLTLHPEKTRLLEFGR